MREIKLRAWDKTRKCFIDVPDLKDLLFSYGCNYDYTNGNDVEISQFTGLKDKNGTPIYEGDVLKVRSPVREQQTHYGDNIPLGKYTEPLEPSVQEDFVTVWYDENSAAFVIDSIFDDGCLELGWLQIEYKENDLRGSFSGSWNFSDQHWADDLEYLLEEYSLSSQEGLAEYLGAEVAGNIYQNQELLND